MISISHSSCIVDVSIGSIKKNEKKRIVNKVALGIEIEFIEAFSIYRLNRGIVGNI